MKLLFSTPTLLFFVLCVHTKNVHSQQRNIIQKKIQTADYHSFLKYGEYKPFPTIEQRDVWENLADEIKKYYLVEAEKNLGKPINILRSSLFLQYKANGNRTNYEAIQKEQLLRLNAALIAECIENKGRFLTDISDLVWAICEETTWSMNAHLHAQKKNHGLADIEDPTIDLWTGEVASQLAMAHLILGKKLDSISTAYRERIEIEILKRIAIPFLSRNDYWWIDGLNHKRPMNNWTPWINSNILFSTMICIKSDSIRKEIIKKTAYSVDCFTNDYPEDGSCDEGPNYWEHAAGSMYVYLEVLNDITKHQIDFFSEKLIKNMAEYAAVIQIGNGYVVNFSDATSKAKMSPYLIYAYSQSLNSKLMLTVLSQRDKEYWKNYSEAYKTFKTIINYSKIESINSTQMKLSDYHWLSGIQVQIARDNSDGKGFFLASQGGHNGESHNHNDVGNYIVYFNSSPLIIDAGAQTYDAKTFGPERYTLWQNNSMYHNVPYINGYMQEPYVKSYTDERTEAKFRATEVKSNNSPATTQFSLETKEAYPSAAGINFWKRTHTLFRKNKIVIEENFSLNTIKDSTYISFMLPKEPRLIEGKVEIYSVANEKFNLEYDKNIWKPIFEKISIYDERMTSSWGNAIYRLRFLYISPQKENKSAFTVKPKK